MQNEGFIALNEKPIASITVIYMNNLKNLFLRFFRRIGKTSYAKQ